MPFWALTSSAGPASTTLPCRRKITSSKIRSMSTTELNSFVREVLPYVTHNITSSTMLQLVASVPSYLSYDVEQSRVPFDNLYTSQGEILVPTQPDTIDKIQEILNS